MFIQTTEVNFIEPLIKLNNLPIEKTILTNHPKYMEIGTNMLKCLETSNRSIHPCTINKHKIVTLFLLHLYGSRRGKKYQKPRI